MAASITASSRDLPIYPRTPSTDPFAFRIFAWCTIGVMALALGGSLALGDHPLRVSPTVFAAWTALAAIASLSSISFGRDIQLAFDLPVLLAAAYVFGPAVGGLMALLGSCDARELKGRVSVLNALFNHAQVSLSVLLAGYVFLLTGGQGKSWPFLLLPAFVALIVDVVVNTLLAAVAAGFKRGIPGRRALHEMKFGPAVPFGLMYFGLGLLAVVLVSAYEAVGLWALAEFLLPLVLARQVFKYGTRLEAQVSEVRRARRALMDLTVTIAEERHDERARIASALHDDVQQALYNATLHAEVIREELKCGHLLALEDDIPRLLQANRRARSVLREVIRDLRRSELGVGGLASTLRLLVEELASSSECRLEAHVEETGGTPEAQLLIYQVAREALQNALQHSGASLIQVRLFRDGERVALVVTDDGRGFHPEEVDQEKHFGLEIMRERAQLAGGTIEINSFPGDGTKIVGAFPAAGGARGG